MPTPFDVFQIPYTTGSKLVARLCLPDGTSTASGTTVAGGLANGGEAVSVPTGSFYVYLALIESPTGYYGAAADIGGTALPNTTTRPYTVEVRVVDGGTDLTSYAALPAAFLGSDTIAYTRDVPSNLNGGYLSGGSWVQDPVTITPFVAAVTNPRYATRDLPPIPRGSAPTDQWTIVDNTGAAVSLSGKTVRFVVTQTTDEGDEDDRTDDMVEAVYQYESGADDNITVSGASSNVVSVTHDPANTATAGNYRYELWNATNDLMLAAGKMPVRPAAKSYP